MVLKKLVRSVRFELTTYGSEDRCSVHLSYERTSKLLYQMITKKLDQQFAQI